MNSGHIYVIHTTLTSPPKDKIVLCISGEDKFFVWINTLPRHHGIGQFPLAAEDHQSLSHDSFLDLSRATTFQANELDVAVDRGTISSALAQRILTYLTDNRPKTLSERYAELLRTMLTAIIGG